MNTAGLVGLNRLFAIVLFIASWLFFPPIIHNEEK